MSSHRGHHSSTAGTSTPIPEHEQWRAKAACLSVDPEMFFPVGEPGSKAYERDAEPARAVCAHCTVLVECLEDSLRLGDKWGIRGGLDPDERGQQFGRRRRRKVVA